MVDTPQQKALAIPRALQSWVGEPGKLFTWGPSSDSITAIENSPRNPIPPSCQQEQHLRSYRAYTENGLEMERLLVVTWDLPGCCDMQLMTEVIQRHLRRQDTYHSWFSFDSRDQVVRRHLEDTSLIEFVWQSRGWCQKSSEWIQHILATPGPLNWDCFSFGVIQRVDNFTFYAAIDHLHGDGYLLPILIEDLCTAYQFPDTDSAQRCTTLASYHHYCERQMRDLVALTLADPVSSGWLEFLRSNGGVLPRFSLPLGVQSEFWKSKITISEIMNSKVSRCFESSCTRHGVSLFTGVMACVALQEHLVTSKSIIHMITPVTTRATRMEFSTLGWFTGLVPISVSMAGGSFLDIVKGVRSSFRSRRHLASVPIEKVIELTQGLSDIHWPAAGGYLISFVPLKKRQFSTIEQLHARLFLNQGTTRNLVMWITYGSDRTMVSISHPDNQDALSSVSTLAQTLQAICLRVANDFSTPISTLMTELGQKPIIDSSCRHTSEN
jgi:hypothetical protein